MIIHLYKLNAQNMTDMKYFGGQGYDTGVLQGPHEVAGQAFLALPSKQMKISKNGIRYLWKVNNLA